MTAIAAVSSRSALAVIAAPAEGDTAYLSEADRSGAFIFRSANLTAKVATDPQQGVYVAPASSPTGAAGAWVRDLAGKALTPYHFGAVDGSADSAAALQAFGDFIAVNPVDDADLSGDFSIATGLVWGTNTIREMAGKTPLVRGNLKLKAIAAIDEMLRLKNWHDMTWEGSLSLTGTGGVNYASRTCAAGLVFAACRAMKLTGRLAASNFSFAGIAFVPGAPNNNYMHLGLMNCLNCGSGVSGAQGAGVSLTSSFTSLTDSGGAGSTVQRTLVGGVTSFPPTQIEDYGAVGDAPIQVRIDGYLYWVDQIDRQAGTILVYPWVRNPGGATSFEWVLGGGLYVTGSDGNVLTFDKLESTVCGRGLAVAALYGPIGTVSTQVCGTGVLLGREPTGACLGSKLGVYMEGNVEDIVTLAYPGPASYHYLTSEYALNLAKCFNTSAPRTTGDVFVDPGFPRIPFVHAGKRHGYEKRARNGNQAFSSLTMVVDRRDLVYREKRNSWSVTLDAIDPDLNRLFGYDGATFIFHGTGANGAPTGAFVFAASTLLRGNTTSGSAIVTGIPSTQLFAAGMPVTGTGIPAGTTIQSIDSASQLTLSQAATQTSTSLGSFPVTYGTVNGGASASFSGFTKPALLSALYDFAARNWDVRLLN